MYKFKVISRVNKDKEYENNSAILCLKWLHTNQYPTQLCDFFIDNEQVLTSTFIQAAQDEENDLRASRSTKSAFKKAITRVSQLSSVAHTMWIPMSINQYKRWLDNVEAVQDIFPELPKEQQEFLITGITPKEREETFGGCDATESDIY